MRLWSASLLALGLGLAATNASAQALEPPAPYQPTDANGVNLVTGSISVSTVEIGVGQKGAGGLFYSASISSDANAWRHSTWGGIQREPAGDPYAPLPSFTVTVLGQSVTFERLGTTGRFQAVDGYGQLTLAAGVYTFTALDGTVATFFKNQASGTYAANEGVIQEIVRPNGERISFTYLGSGTSPAANRIPLSITNNLGYQIHFEYSSGLNAFTVTALNNGVDACSPTATTCTFSQTWPSLTLGQPTNNERTATDNLGRTLRIGLTSGKISSWANPSQTAGWSASVTRYLDPTRLTLSDGVGSWDYRVPPRNTTTGTSTTTITDPNSNVTQYHFSWQVPDAGPPMPKLQWIKDGLNRTTQMAQDGGGLHLATYPEGDGVVIFRNLRGDIETVTRNAKPGSGLADTVVTATYGDCSTPILCGRPTSVTDASGAVTDYTYDAAGNLLTETGPAPTPGAPRPQTRYVWEQRYAWYKQNGAAAITQAASPVWVMVEQSQCMTGATC